MGLESNLFNDFGAVSKEDWVNAVEKHLKGKALDSLNWKLNSALEIAPVYRKEELNIEENSIVNRGTSWKINEFILLQEEASSEEINKQVLFALEQGVSALTFVIDKVISLDWNLILKGVHIEWIDIHFQGAFVVEQQLFTEDLKEYSRLKELRGTVETNFKTEAEAKFYLEQTQLSCFTVTVNNDTINIENNLLQALEDVHCIFSIGDSKEQQKQLLERVHVVFDLSDAYFVEIAKIQSFKRLCVALLESYDHETLSFPYFSAVTTMDSNKDEYWNMLKATTQSMSASIGGVNCLKVTPATGIMDMTDFSARMARNIQHLLEQESYFTKVANPADGSYYITGIKELLLTRVWQKFCSNK